MKKKILTAAGLVCIIFALVCCVVLDLPTMHEETVRFSSTYGEEAVTLEASYYPVPDAEYAVLICPGYSCDRQKWRPMAGLCAANGLAVMTFDYSGQGASGGVIGFDNAKTDHIPAEIGDAIEQLHRLSGMDYDHIVLLGHSMGGRSILRLMYDWRSPDAVTRAAKRPVGSVILISPEVNYHFNAQASLFAGTSDDAEEPWHSYSAAWTEGVKVFLFGSTADDIVSDEDVWAIYRHLGGEAAPESGAGEAAQVNAAGASIRAAVTDGVLHSYQMYSPRFASLVNGALEEITGREARYPAWQMLLVYAAWFLGLAGVGLTLAGINARSAQAETEQTPVLLDTGRFLRRKALMWLPGVGAAFVVCCLCVAMPFGSPVMNIPYMCFIAGYGLVMLLAWRKGHFPGTEGKLPALSFRAKDRRQAEIAAAMTVGLCAFVWLVLRATMYRLIPINARLFWVLAATVLMAAGYYVSGCERDMMKKAGVSGRAMLAYNLIVYVPLFLLVGFYLVLKSYSGLIGQVQNMVLMYVFCIPLGDMLRRRTGNRLIGALASAFLFQTLMITSAALISLF